MYCMYIYIYIYILYIYIYIYTYYIYIYTIYIYIYIYIYYIYIYIHTLYIYIYVSPAAGAAINAAGGNPCVPRFAEVLGTSIPLQSRRIYLWDLGFRVLGVIISYTQKIPL